MSRSTDHSLAEHFRTSPKIKEISGLFADIKAGLDKNTALHRTTTIGRQLGGNERHALVDMVYGELRKRG